MNKVYGTANLTIGDVELVIEYEADCEADTCEADIFVVAGQNETFKYLRKLDWENEMYDPQFAHISTERLEKAIALDIAKNVA